MRQKQLDPRKIGDRRKHRRSYTQANIEAAYSLIKTKGLSIRKAAEKTNVPVTTLHDKVSGKNGLGAIWGKAPVLTRLEEEKLVKHVVEQAKFGYGMTRKTIRNVASEIIRKRPSPKPTDTPRKLTNGWFHGLMRRWPSLKIRKPQRMNLNRASATSESVVNNYFNELHTIMEKYGLTDRPDLIYNVDETGFLGEHSPPKVVAEKTQNQLNSITSPRSATTTVLATTNAMGNSLPPYFVFKGKRKNEDLMKGALPGSSFSMSDSGWSNGDIFMNYVQNHFLKYVRPPENQKVMLLYDGHTSHISIPLIEYARDNGVILFVLPAHTSHVLQPLDVGCFGPYKRAYDQECYHFLRRNPGQVVSRYDMCQLLSDAYRKALTPTNICNSFRKCGIYPFDPSAVSRVAFQPAEGLSPRAAAAQTETSASDHTDVVLAEHATAGRAKPKKKRKAQWRPAGMAVTETSILLKLRRVQVEREQRATKKSTMESPSEQVDANQPGPSGIPAAKISDIQSSEEQSEDDQNCCFCGKWSPPGRYPTLCIVKWAQCDACPHWTHLSFCCETTEVGDNDSFLCPHCLEE